MRAVAHPRRLASVALLGAAAALWTAQPGQAQGFSVYEHGSCAMARAGATVAAPCNDGSAVFYNPAGIAGKKGATISLGTTVVAASGEWRPETGNSSELQNDPILVPHGYLTYGLNEKLAVGLGLYVPYGLGTKWPTKDFLGRFLGYDNSLQSIYIQPTIAYQLSDKLSVGGGLTYVMGKIEINQRLDVSEQVTQLGQAQVPFTVLGAPVGSDFADGKLEGDGTGFGANFGVHFKATDRLSFGVKYLTKVKIDYDGTADFTAIALQNAADPTNWTLKAALSPQAPAGTPIRLIPAGVGVTMDQALKAGIAAQFIGTGKLVDQSIKATLSMPAQLIAGIAFQAAPKLLLLGDYQWTQWSSFKEIKVEFETYTSTRYELYKDTHAFRVGADYAFSDAFVLRAGALMHSAAAPDETVTPLLPEGNRKEATIGAGFHLTKAIELNAAYQYLKQDDREGRVREAAAGAQPTTALNSGTYSFSGNLFGATLTFHF